MILYSLRYFSPGDITLFKKIESNINNISYENENQKQSYEIEEKESQNNSIFEIFMNDSNKEKNSLIFNIEKKLKKEDIKKIQIKREYMVNIKEII